MTKSGKVWPKIWQLFQVESHKSWWFLRKNKFDTESHFDNSGGKNLNQNKLSFKTLILTKSTI